MKLERKTLAEITNRAIEVLLKELGPSDAMRFLNQFSNGRGDYTAERNALFDDVAVDRIIAEIRSENGPRSGGATPMGG